MESTEKTDLKTMIMEYMEKGFLDNIIAMFKYDKTLYPLIGELMTDERMVVRMGITALVEELITIKPEEVKLAIPSLKAILTVENPTTRGDVAYLIGIIGGKEEYETLKPLLNDPNPQVAEVVKDLLEDLD